MSLSFAYVFANNFQFFVQAIYKESSKEIEQTIRLSLEKNIKITTILEDILFEVNEATRVIVYQYHNGIKGVTSIPFLYSSATFEVVELGISNQLRDLQNLPITLDMDALAEFFRGECYIYEINFNRDNKYNLNDSLLYKRGTVAIISCPLFDSYDQLIGHVDIDFRNHIDIQKGDPVIQVIKAHLNKIKDLL